MIKPMLGGIMLARTEAEMFIQGPKMAGARPTVATFPICTAIPEARPPFCIPTSIEMVRQERSSMPTRRQPQ